MVRNKVLGVIGALGAGVLLSGCSLLRGEIGLNDPSVVRTPAYSANKVLFLDPTDKPIDAADPGRYVPLAESYELAQRIKDNKQIGLRRSILNRQPVSIVISRAYVPASLTQCSPRATDIVFGKGRDIAVLLEVATATNEHQFIAVWYQQDVKPGDLLNFQDLLVYSRDAWDSKFPPYFRMRLVDVSSERNTAMEGLLKQISGASQAITGLAGAPEATPIVGIAAMVGNLVLGHDKNVSLVDFTFQLYGASLLNDAGGVPLGVLQSGGVLVSAPPCGATNDYWAGKLRFDYRLNRIEDPDGKVQELPYVSATILNADLSVPQIVRTRSDAIVKRLTDPQLTQSDLLTARTDADKLSAALSVLNRRESYRRRPGKDAFFSYLTDVSTTTLDDAEKGFYLDNLYQITGVQLSDFAAYQTWYANCGGVVQVDTQTGRFDVDQSKLGKDGKPCWSQ